jgi:single-stranded-DNA-specific exonuclease
LAQQLDALNRERREIESDMQLDALAAIDDVAVAGRTTICLFDESWHQGVVGLVASRIKEKFHRPTIAFARSDASELRGSGRSIDGVHLRHPRSRHQGSTDDGQALRRLGAMAG